MFIDWSSHRTVFEQEATRLLGHPVRVKGKADAQILPIPSFTFTDVEVGADPSAPIMTAARLKVRVELIPLVQREIEVIDMELDNPQVSVRLSDGGKSNWTLSDNEAGIANAFSIKLGPVTINDGVVYFANTERNISVMVEDIDASVTAQSLLGPWKVEGTGVEENGRLDFKISTGKYEKGTLRTKLALQPDELHFDAVFDGVLSFVDEADKPKFPDFSGDIRLGAVEFTEDDGVKKRKALRDKGWRLEGGFELDGEKFLISRAVFEDGAREAPLNLNGALRIPFSSKTRFDAVVSSRQIDLDRAYGGGPNEPLQLDKARAVLASLIGGLPKPPIPGQIGVDIPGIVIAGDVIRSVHFDATPTDTGWKLDDFGAILPGSTQLRFDGSLEVDEGLNLGGDFGLSSNRPIAFARWWRPEKAQALRRTRVNSYSLSGNLLADQEGLRLSNLTADIGGSDLAGDISISRFGDNFNRLEADLRAQKLNFDAVQVLAALLVGDRQLSGVGRNDTLSVKLSAKSFIAQSLEGKDANLDLNVSNGEIDIRNFQIAEFAGAKLSASGQVKDLLSEPTGRFSADVEAQSIVGLTKVGEALFPGHPALKYLKRNGEALVPLDLDLKFSGQRDNTGDGESNDIAVSIAGTLGDSELKSGFRFVGELDKPLDGSLNIALTSKHQQTSDLLRKVDWPYVDTGQKGEAEISIDVEGRPRTGLASKINAKLLGVTARGDLKVSVKEDYTPVYEGPLAIVGHDVEPLLQLLGYQLPGMGLGTSANFVGVLNGESYSGNVDQLTATFAENLVKGDLQYTVREEDTNRPWIWSGKLSTDELSLPWIFAFATGETMVPRDIALELVEEGLTPSTDASEQTQTSQSNFWPQKVFGNPYLQKIQTDFSINTEKLILTKDFSLEDARFDLALRDQSMTFSKVYGAYQGGDLTGRLSLENASGVVSLSGTFDLNKARAADILWSDEQRPLVEGGLSISTHFDGVGRSFEAIVASLSGGGSFSLDDARLRRINPAAFGRLIEAADNDLELDQKTVRPLVFSHLDSGALDLKKAEAPFDITGGMIRVANTTLETDGDYQNLETLFSGSLDLNTLRLEGSLALNVDSASIDAVPVSGAVPEIAVLFEGPIGEPERTIDVQPLLGYLTVRRFEQEVRQVERLQADILEKQRLSRYARWITAEEEREVREAEEAELRRQEEAKRQEELRKQAAERQKREQALREQQAAEARAKAEAEARARAEAEARERAEAEARRLAEERDRLEREALARAIAEEEIRRRELEVIQRQQQSEPNPVTQPASVIDQADREEEVEVERPPQTVTRRRAPPSRAQEPINLEREIRNLERSGLRRNQNRGSLFSTGPGQTGTR